MKKTIIVTLFLISFAFTLKAQQIGDGFAPVIPNFGDILNSGVYNGVNASGSVPDNSHPWQHLLVIRHPNTNNNHQFQLGTTFAENDRLFFRKIANDLIPSSPSWIELATRGSNTFTGDQYIIGNVGIGTTLPWSGAKLTVENVIATKPSGVNGYYSYLKSNWSQDNAFELGINDGSNWHKLVTSSNYHFGSTLQFWTADIERIRISSDGNVGIGTTTPRVKLNPVVTSHNESPTLGSASGGFLLGEISNNYGLLMGIGNSGNTWMQVQRVDGTATSYNLVLQPSGGNVGIGTTTPLAKLHVSTDINLGSSAGNNVLQMVVRGVANNNIYRKEWTYRESAGSDWLTAGWFDGIDIDGVFPTPMSDTKCWYKRIPYGATLRHSWGDGSTTFLGIYYNGNIGIGTNTPQNKLDVAGTIRCTEVKVEALPWADFVFYPNYKLRTLGEVEQFIKTNNHLPEIPTEKEVQENGVGLGEMNAKLLQKVEELTLYMIEQQKQLNELKEQNAKLATEMETLKKK